MREIVPEPVFATHTASTPTVIAVGPSPTGIAVTDPAPTSIRCTRSAPALTTHTSPKPATIALGRLPTLTESTSASESGLKRWTVDWTVLATHTEP